MITKDIGNIGEDLAKNYLEDKGYILIERNYSWGLGEIDLIMLHDDIIVFVEVKLRKNDLYGRPRDFVTPNKQKKIMITAENYILKNGLENYQPRFDVVEILMDNKYIEHIENAFP
ncbi:YraN family protein [Lagierella sp.]|uniref:YraN family protein n=1 Tax=Lagierella sp. TaxID=2849657 RepID=UPI002616331A|nr:YraN family protein [Lagierella sp.]